MTTLNLIPRVFTYAAITWCTALLTGCCGHSGSPRVEPTMSQSPTDAQQQPPDASVDGNGDAKPAWMVREAKLPQGFPPPGAVGQITLKHYPAYRAAFVSRAADTPSQNEMFRVLFRHIKKHDIAMTAPVEMTFADDADSAPGGRESVAAMAFMYARPDMGVTGPDEENVLITDIPAMTVLSVGIRGGYGDKRMTAAFDKLYEHVRQHADRYRVVGAPRFLGYNSPFVPPFLRYGEAQLPVEILEPQPAPKPNP